MRLHFLAAIALLLQGCSQPSKVMLVPQAEITVYADMKGDRLLGRSHKPMTVVKCIYPDKTDYVVEVEYEGGYAYVREGLFVFERTGGDQISRFVGKRCGH